MRRGRQALEQMVVTSEQPNLGSVRFSAEPDTANFGRTKP
jgi:hypothetical protein